MGCDSGIITTFLAQTFPEKTIISIDRNNSSIECTRKICKKLGIRNVELITTDLQELYKRSFDTIFFMNVLNENHYPVDECLLDEYPDLSNKYAESLVFFCNLLKKIVKDNGNVISIDCTVIDAFFGGYIQSMTKKNLIGEISTFKEIHYNDQGQKGHMIGMSFKSMKKPEVTQGDVLPAACNSIWMYLIMNTKTGMQ